MDIRIFFILYTEAVGYKIPLLTRFSPLQELIFTAKLQFKPLIWGFLRKIDQRAHIDLNRNQASIGHIQVNFGRIIEAQGEVIARLHEIKPGLSQLFLRLHNRVELYRRILILKHHNHQMHRQKDKIQFYKHA